MVVEKDMYSTVVNMCRAYELGNMKIANLMASMLRMKITSHPGVWARVKLKCRQEMVDPRRRR